MRRDKRIQLLRVIAMMMIVVCHLVMQYNSVILSMTGQFFNVGVYIFLLISGVLYSRREINNYVKWFFKKMGRLLIPVYLFLPIIFVLDYVLLNSFSLESVFAYVFNLQGILGGIQGAGHLWFLTTIMFCYLMIPCLYWSCKLSKKGNSHLLICGMLVLGIIVSFVNGYVGQQVFYILAFSIGYIYAPLLKKASIKSVVLLLTILLVLGLRLVLHGFLDNTVIYTTIASSLIHIIISVCVFVLMFQSNVASKIKDEVLNELDSVSYCVYIVHYAFMVGPISLMHISAIPLLNTAVTLAASYVSAKLLQISSKHVNGLVFGGRR